MQFILCNIERRDNALKRLQIASGGILTKSWDGKSIPVIVGNLHGAAEIQIECRKQGIHYILIDHGYFNRDIGLSVARFCVDNYHCTDWRTSDRPIPKVKAYRSGKTIVVIPPSDYAKLIYKAENWLDETLEQLKNYTDRKVIVKPKSEGVLKDYLRDAHALVSFGSVSEVEAAIAGVPVFVSEHSPLAPINQPLSNIETPDYPEREAWLRSLAASQWYSHEMNQCWERLKTQL
jgi:hypothetical protein